MGLHCLPRDKEGLGVYKAAPLREGEEGPSDVRVFIRRGGAGRLHVYGTFQEVRRDPPAIDLRRLASGEEGAGVYWSVPCCIGLYRASPLYWR
jgi:hypothetical protein